MHAEENSGLLRTPPRPAPVLQDFDAHLNLYVRLARLMQQKIRTGEWKPGTQIPTLPELAQSFGISRPSVRQAVALLVQDGLLTSARGRGTFVTDRLGSILDDSGLRVSISDPLALGTGQTISILSRETIAALPPEIAAAEGQYPAYIVTAKTHGYQDKPFAAMRIYVAAMLSAQIPPGLDQTHKIVPLLLKYTGLRPVRYRQEITIVHATPEIASQLALPIASTLVQIRRWWTDEAGRIAWATFGQYRSDMFVLDVTFEDAGGNLGALITPRAAGHPNP
jgi:DNA-binding GntR family transcriptional regulator